MTLFNARVTLTPPSITFLCFVSLARHLTPRRYGWGSGSGVCVCARALSLSSKTRAQSCDLANCHAGQNVRSLPSRKDGLHTTGHWRLRCHSTQAAREPCLSYCARRFLGVSIRAPLGLVCIAVTPGRDPKTCRPNFGSCGASRRLHSSRKSGGLDMYFCLKSVVMLVSPRPDHWERFLRASSAAGEGQLAVGQ